VPDKKPSQESERDAHLAEVERGLAHTMQVIQDSRREIARSRQLLGSQPLPPASEALSEPASSPQEPSR
jgi:hypothetical protein